MSKYKANKQDAIYFNDEPSMTDQSLAEHTDINVIVNQFLRTGHSPQPAQPPIYGDFSQLPNDLRGFIEMGRSMAELRERLPQQLQGLNAQELFALTTEQINNMLKPVEPKKEGPT